MNVQGREDPFLKVGQSNTLSSKEKEGIVWALRDINLSVEQGEVLGIIGKNGAGKSTLLKLLSRVTAPTTGRIRAWGRVASLLEVGTGFHPEMTGRENIYMNGSIMGMTKAEINRKFDEIVDFAGVERYIDTPVKRYSSGMTVRLGFAIAAHLEPEILVVDEVLAVGDAEFQKKAIGKMQDISKGEGRTVLFVSHNMTAVRKLCNSGIILKNGSVDFIGSTPMVIEKYLEEQENRSKLEIEQISDRTGNGLLRFQKVDFIDSKGNSRDTFEVGEELIIKLYVKTAPDFWECSSSRIDIAINDMLDSRISWMSTFMFMDRVNISNSSISFKIPKLMLSEGVYNINLFCSTNKGLADWVKNVAAFKVVFYDFYKSGRKIPEKQGSLIMDYSIL